MRAGPTHSELSQQEVLTRRRGQGDRPTVPVGSADPCRGGAGRDSRRTSVSATAGQAQDERGQAERLGIKPGQVVQEIGYDDDCDEQLRGAITRIDGVELVDEDYDDVVDRCPTVVAGRGRRSCRRAGRRADAARRRGVHLAAHAEGGPGGSRRAERRRRGRADGRPVADLERERGPRLVGHAAGRSQGAPVGSWSGNRGSASVRRLAGRPAGFVPNGPGFHARRLVADLVGGRRRRRPAEHCCRRRP